MKQRSDEWLKARHTLLTASDVAAVLHLDPNKSALSVWKEKTQPLKKTQPNFHMQRGIELEPVARRAYERFEGVAVHTSGLQVHPTIKWLGASPDGLVHENGLIEIKCPQNLTDSVPIAHFVQMQTQMYVVGREWCDYVVYTKTESLVTRVYRDLEWWNDKFDTLVDFWHNNVLKKIQPKKRRKK